MKTETKFFNADGQEVLPEDAVEAVRLTFDDDGLIVKSEWFRAVEGPSAEPS